MADALQVELVTPEKMIFSGSAEMVEAPGVEGDFGVLVNHSPLVSLLREGEVVIHANGAKQRYQVTGGTAEVNEEGIVILAESAVAAA
jgi:F-type H+-transporting ATPase subunit epsilon